MTRPRDSWQQAGAKLAVDAFDAGVRTVLLAVMGNAPLGDVGIGGDLSDEDLEAVRWLRQQVHRRKAYDYTPNRPRPKKWGAVRSLAASNRIQPKVPHDR